MNEVVQYSNILNTLQLKGFTAMDYNIFFALCYKMKNQGRAQLKFKFDELKDLTGFEAQSDKLFADDLERMIEKLLKVNAKHITGDERTYFVLFPTFKVDFVKRDLTVRVNKDFAFILNALTDNFTQFELKEFVELDSKYAKSIYKVLKQYRFSGWWKPTVEELRLTMDIPENYANKRIMGEIIKPALALLEGKFEDLKCEPVRAKKKGAPVERYHFTWQAEKQIKGQMNIADFPGTLPGEEQPKQKKKKQNNFNNFEQRKYTSEEMAELEKKLLDN